MQGGEGESLVSCSGSLSRLLLCAPPELDPNSRSLKAEGIAQTILKVALIREMHQRWIIDEEDEGRRIHPCLCGVVHFQQPITNHSRMMTADRILHHLVEARGRYAEITHLGDIERRFEQ